MTNTTFNPQTTIVDWCNKMSRSVTRRDLREHMSQISHKLRIYGVPGYKYLSFYDWEKRRRHEFKHDHLLTLTYKLIKIKSSAARRIIFHSEETMHGHSGQVIILNKEIILELASDGKNWQSVEETVQNWKTA